MKQCAYKVDSVYLYRTWIQIIMLNTLWYNRNSCGLFHCLSLTSPVRHLLLWAHQSCIIDLEQKDSSCALLKWEGVLADLFGGCFRNMAFSWPQQSFLFNDWYLEGYLERSRNASVEHRCTAWTYFFLCTVTIPGLLVLNGAEVGN
mgnify:CR=1 FL=1